MKATKFLFLLMFTTWSSGCGVTGTLMISDGEAFNYDKKYFTEHEEVMQVYENTSIEKWIQPSNKKEECRIFISTPRENDRTLHSEYRAFWDGQCKNGYANGLGREFEKGFLTDVEAIALYSGSKDRPTYYYQKDKLKNIKFEGVDGGSNSYGVVTSIQDENLDFKIDMRYGKLSGEKPQYLILTSPQVDNVIYMKIYDRFAYRIIDSRSNDLSDFNFQFDTLGGNGKENGFSFVILKNGQRASGEVINGVMKRRVELPQSYYNNAEKIRLEIIEAGKEALKAQAIALQVKRQYKHENCLGKTKVSFLDELEYKAFCEEDKYIAEIKEKLDKELEKINAKKAQDRIARTMEAEAAAAKQQAAVAQRQVDSAQRQAVIARLQESTAAVAKSTHDMNMNMLNTVQQNNANLMNYSSQASGSSSVGNTLRCPHDNNPLYPGGETKLEAGTMLKKYRCTVGHTQWLAY